MSDAALGALTGSAFSVVYALLGLWFGRLADRTDRLRLVRIGACVWSFASLGAAFAPSYAWLIAARAGVAVGEAFATAAAFSMVAELSGARHRARALSLFLASAFIGIGLAAVMGGMIVQEGIGFAGMAGWRLAFIAAGIPGLIGAVYLAGVAQPGSPVAAAMVGGPTERGLWTLGPLAATASATVLVQMLCPATVGVPVAVTLALAGAAVWGWAMRRVDGVVAGRSAFDATLGNTAFRWFLVAFSAVLFLDSSAEFWLIPFAQRRYTIGAGQSGAELGGMLLLGGAAGCLGGGWFADRWQARSRHGRAATAAGAFTIEVAALLGAVMQPDYGSFLWCFGVFCVASGAWAGLAAAIGLDLVPRAHHSSAVAIYFLFTTLTGPALGPFVTGISSGRLGSVGNALIVSSLVAPLALWGLTRLTR